MIRMRTVHQIVDYFKENDPDTRVNSWMIYSMLRSGQLNHLKVGNKYLIDLDQFIEFLRTGQNITNDSINNINERIRKVY